jgi:Ca2+-binding RTX toxin-like protein
MANDQLKRYLEFANLQMAAEAFLLREGEQQVPAAAVSTRLQEGNNHASRFMPGEADRFATEYEVLAQYRNDARLTTGSGFSGTLFKNRATGELTLSLRSTEFIDDAVRDTLATGRLEIKDLGWAFGQIAEMEQWYAQLRADPNLLGGKSFNVTGYSLGGHLATAFNILRREEVQAGGQTNPIVATYTFNGAGVGGLTNGRRLTDVISDFIRFRDDPNLTSSAEWAALPLEIRNQIFNQAVDRVSAIEQERLRLQSLQANFSFDATPPAGSSSSLQYQIAALLAARDTVPSAIYFPLPGGVNWTPISPVFADAAERFTNMTEIVGNDTGVAGGTESLALSFVSNSGIHYGVRQEIYIENQPLLRGAFLTDALVGLNLLVNNPDVNNFADTHSLVLLVDSLSLMAAVETIDPNISPEVLREVLGALSTASASSTVFTQGKAEGDVLERALDALRTLFQGPGQEPSVDYRATLLGNTWHTAALREPYHDLLQSLRNSINTTPGPLTFASLASSSAAELSTRAQAANGLAYRYALNHLNPFAILGSDTVYDSHNQSGQLNLYDPAGSVRSGMTSDYIIDRSQMLAFSNTANTNNTNAFGSNQVTDQVRYTDFGKVALGDGGDFVVFLPGGVPNFNGPNTRRVAFGTDGTDALGGRDNTDRLYGGAGTDVLSGKGGNDYLEGGTGLDLYAYGAQTVLGVPSNDGSDTILDIDGKGVLRYSFRDGFFANPQSTVIVDASVKLSGATWRSADGKFTYTKTGPDLVVTIDGVADASITLKDWREGDFGIRLWEARTAPDFAATENVIPGGDDDPNTLTGTDAAELIQAFGENDTVNAGGGDDILEGGTGSDILDGQGNNDRVYGDAGDDEVTGGLGDDEIYGGTDRDFVSDAGGTNLLEGNAGADVLYAFGAGRDELYADARVDLSTAILNAEQAGSGLKGDWLMAGADADLVVGASADDVLMGGGGNDIIVGGAGDDNLEGDLGWVTTSLDWSATRTSTTQPDGSTLHQLVYDPAVVLDATAGGNDVIYAGSGVDWVRAGVGDDFVDAGSGDDKAWGEAGSDVMVGGLGNDLLVGDNPGFVTGGAEGGDYLDGGAGDDELFGNGGSDILIGGAGNDILVGGAGKDIYVFNKGDGTETVFDDDASSSSPDASVLVLGDGVSRSDIKFRTGSLAVDLGPSNPDDPDSPRDIIHFEGFDQLTPTNGRPIGEIRFADGTSMSYDDILAQGFDIDGTEASDDNHDAAHPQLVGTGVTDRIRGLGGDDIIAGIGGEDTLDGGAGNDLIVGGAGMDVLIGGSGVDQLQGGSGADSLYGGDEHDDLFGDADDATELTSGDDILDGGGGDDFLAGNAGNDTLYGGDGGDNLQGQTGTDVIEGGAGNDFLYGDGVYFFNGQPIVNLADDGAADTLRGGDGDDQLDAASGDDVLEGGAGADILFAGAGNDTVGGDAGADVLFGEGGGDTYLFNLGDGLDLIVEDAAISTEVLRFGPGIVLSDLTFSRTSGDLVISHANGTDQVTIASWYAGSGFQMTRLEFADGSQLSGTEAGNRGLQLQFGTAGNDNIFGTTGNDALYGLGGNDIITGNGGNDTFIGGTGDDTLNASSGNDTYDFASGDGAETIRDTGGSDALIFEADISKSQITPSRSAGDLVLTRTGTTDKVTIKDWFNVLANKVESITFAGTGEAFADAELIDPFLTFNGTAAVDVLAGGAYGETFSGFAGDDLIQAGGGDDVITGGAGNDNLFGDSGFDTFRFAAGDGQDTVNDSDGRGVVHFGPGLGANAVFTPVATGLQITFTGSTDSVLIKDPTIPTFNRVQAKFDIIGTEGNDTIVGSSFNDVIQGLGGADSINGANGAEEIYGGAGDDTLEGGGAETDSSRDSLFGGDGNDILDSGLRASTGDVGGSLTGGPGNDQLFGSSGVDRYFFNLGDGQDTVNDEPFFGNGQWHFALEDEVVFGPGITRDAIGARFSGADLIVQVSPNDQIILKNWTDIMRRVDRFVFADGTSMNDVEIQELANTITGTADNDALTGTEQANTIRGLGGDDTMSGLGGDDKLTGGTGNDVVDGGTGNDGYFFNVGDGNDRITDSSGTDTLQLGPGITAGGVTLGRSANSLVLTLAGGAGSVTIDNYLVDPARQIENFQFADGSTLPDAAMIVDTLVNMRGTPGNDTLTGTAGFDIISGFEGDDDISSLGDNDNLLAGPGADTYRFNAGDGADLIVDPDAGNRVLFGAGIAPANVATIRNGDVLTLSVTGTTDQLSIEDYFVDFQVDEFRFTDGTVWTAQTIRDKVLTGTSGPDLLVGFPTDDTIQGLDGDDQLYGNGGNDALDGGTGNDFLSGNDGDDVLIAGNGDSSRSAFNTLNGGAGIDLFFGGAGADQMSDPSGNNLFYAAAGVDQLRGSDQNDLFIGGAGNDVLDADAGLVNGIAGNDIVLFNRADGQDSAVRLGAATALSIGGLTSYTQIKLDRNGNQLLIKTGKNYVAFDDWYDGSSTASRPLYLQIMAEGLRRYDPASTDPLLNRKVQLFDLQGLIAAFDQAQAAGQRFVVADHLAQFHISGNDTEAYGGAAAYQYGTTGTLDALSSSDLRSIVGAPEFGLQVQSIGAPSSAAAITALAAVSDASDPETGETSSNTSQTQESVVISPASSNKTSSFETDSSQTVQSQPADSSTSSGSEDPLSEKLEELIDSWFADATAGTLRLSHFEEIGNGVIANSASQIKGSALDNAVRWSLLPGRLVLHLAQYGDVGQDLSGPLSDVSISFADTGIFAGSGGVGLGPARGQELKPLEGLSEGFANLR